MEPAPKSTALIVDLGPSFDDQRRIPVNFGSDF
jgi:hypothetical protein